MDLSKLDPDRMAQLTVAEQFEEVLKLLKTVPAELLECLTIGLSVKDAADSTDGSRTAFFIGDPKEIGQILEMSVKAYFSAIQKTTEQPNASKTLH